MNPLDENSRVGALGMTRIKSSPEETPARRRERPDGGAPYSPVARARAEEGDILRLVVALALATACGEKAVTSVPNESDAIEILDVLGQNRLEAEKREVGEGEVKRWEIVVDEGVFGGGEAALAVQVLRDYGLPRPEEPAGDEGRLHPSERAEKCASSAASERTSETVARHARRTLALVTVVMPQDLRSNNPTRHGLVVSTPGRAAGLHGGAGAEPRGEGCRI